VKRPVLRWRDTQVARMSFTGSPEVGKLVARECGQNLVPVKLELGGKGAAVVFDDVNLDKTVDALVSAITLNAGQVCCTASRWLLQDTIYGRFIDAASSRLKQIQIGYGHDPDTQMGPVVSGKQATACLAISTRRAGKGPISSWKVERPEFRDGKRTLRQASHDCRFVVNIACREEIFGPVPTS